MIDLPTEGAANEELRRQGHEWWMEAAARAGLDLAGFAPDAPLSQRLIWAHQAGLEIATILTRYSSKEQHSTADQVRPCVYFAGQNRLYVPPELICVDEAVKGRKVRRDGLDRLKRILEQRHATVLLVFKVSRLFRQAYLGYQLFQTKLVEKGLRGISVSQGIDTLDKKVWKAQCQLHGMLDDLLVDAIADHAREGLIGLFKQGYVTGALTVGYRAVPVPCAPPTRRGKPRTMPAIDEKAADLIRQHVGWHLGGMPLMQGLRRWRAAGGPCDPRATTGKMSYQAYRRLLSKIRLTCRWEFCRKRNTWSSEGDYTKQVLQPDSEVHAYQCEELRILPDEQFFALQQKLKELEVGPRGPRRPKEPCLHDLVIDVFHCLHCRRRFHTCGARGQAMRCPNLDCPTPAMVHREKAVAALCDTLTALLLQDHDLIERILFAAPREEARGYEEVAREVAERERRIRTLTNRVNDLTELAGEGSEADRAELKAKIRAVQAERTAEQLELAQLKRTTDARRAVDPCEVRQSLADFGSILRDGAAGRLGPEVVYRAADLFRRLVGSRVWVDVEVRAGRKRGVVRGRFTPQLVTSVAEACGISGPSTETAAAEVKVWLRGAPRLDVIAPEVRRLYEEEGLGFREIARRLRIGCGNIYQSYQRYYEMQGLPVPPRRPRGRPKSARGRSRDVGQVMPEPRQSGGAFSLRHSSPAWSKEESVSQHHRRETGRRPSAADPSPAPPDERQRLAEDIAWLVIRYLRRRQSPPTNQRLDRSSRLRSKTPPATD